MNLFLNIYSETYTIMQLEWALYDGDECTESGHVTQETPSSTFEMIMFLLAVGKCSNIIGYDLEHNIKLIGALMKRNNLSLERQGKPVRVDLGKSPPETMSEIITNFKNSLILTCT